MSESQANWQLDRRISVGHLVTTITFLVAMVMWGARLETRIALHDETLNRQPVTDSRQDMETYRIRKEIREELRRMNSKLDRYFEHHLKKSV